MKNPNELNEEERDLILLILKEINHQNSDYSDVQVGDVITAQGIAQKNWMPVDCYRVPHNTSILLDAYCEYGYLEKGKLPLQYKITERGLSLLRSSV